MQLHNAQLEYVQQQVARGDYQVDCHEVAAAILERLRAVVNYHEAVSGSEDDRGLPPALNDLPAI